MYIRVTRGRFDATKHEDVAQFLQDIAAAVKQLPGFRAARGGIDRGAGMVTFVSTWDSDEAARFSRDSLGEVMRRTQTLGIQLEPPEVYEVVAQA